MRWQFLDFTGDEEQAEGQVTVSKENLYADRQTVTLEVMQSLLDVTSAEAQIVFAAAEVASAEANLAAAVGSYQAGVGTFLDVIDAQAALLKARVDEYTARYGLSIARASLQHATGASVPAVNVLPGGTPVGEAEVEGHLETQPEPSSSVESGTSGGKESPANDLTR
jgi:outer membrane protein TolC